MRLKYAARVPATDLDGWNQYAALAYLWDLAGLNMGAFPLAELVPVRREGDPAPPIDKDPFCFSLVEQPDGVVQPAGQVIGDVNPYFLPVGPVGNPAMPMGLVVECRGRQG